MESNRLDEDRIPIEDLEFADEELEIATRLQDVINEEERRRIQSLKSVQRQKLMAEVKKMDDLLNKIQSQNISYTNELIYAAAIVVTERLGVKIDRLKS